MSFDLCKCTSLAYSCGAAALEFAVYAHFHGRSVGTVTHVQTEMLLVYLTAQLLPTVLATHD